ncbi:hypothetical protein BGX27_010407 [Mortierella sp. AM989]|nr:hypothetical protein BGX27_010407 [Mortierella sp. AM989]
MLQSCKKSEQALVTDEIVKLRVELKQLWDEFELDRWDNLMDFIACFTIYFEELPNPELSYIVLFIMACHSLAMDKFCTLGCGSAERVNTTYYAIFSRYLNDTQLGFYRSLFEAWTVTLHREQPLKELLPTVTLPIVRDFMWADWRNENIAMVAYIRTIMVVNFPNEEMHSALSLSTGVYMSLQCGLLNDMASVAKDKNSNEINFFIDVAPGTVMKQKDLFEEVENYINTVNLSDNYKLVLRSTLHGSYILYTGSKRYYGKSQCNW